MSLVLKLQTKTGQLILRDLTKTHTVLDLKAILSEKCKIPKNSLYVLSGFPPRPVNLSNNMLTLDSVGVNNGDTLIIEEKAGVSEEIVKPSVPVQSTCEEQLSCPGILMRRVVPADNSCLFTSVGFTLSGKVDTECGSFMRQLIAEHVTQDPINYSEAILGKPPKEYCEWILKPDSWGGAIELSVLSRYYGIEMDVVNTPNAIINRFGEDQDYAQRVFLIFDGVHYDPLYLEPLVGTDEIRTIFSITDEGVLKDAETLAHEAKSSRQFTDVNKFSLKCLDCQCMMQGQKEAQEHAKSFGHLQFGEI